MNIKHNLNKYPSVIVIDSAGTEVKGDINYIDKNNITINFSADFTGKISWINQYGHSLQTEIYRLDYESGGKGNLYQAFQNHYRNQKVFR